jgi:hypothetical protein
LKTELAQFVTDWVDTKTMQLKVLLQPSDLMAMDEDEPCAERRIVNTGSAVDRFDRRRCRPVQRSDCQIPSNSIFKDFAEDEFLETLQKAKLRTWDKGSVIMREGKKGRTFYVIESGEVEILVKTAFEDPMATPNNYFDYHDQSSLQRRVLLESAHSLPGEPRAASVRAAVKTRCFAFDKDDIPASSVLSGKAGQATPMRLAEVNDKYGVDVSALELIQVRKSIEDSKLGSQIRGSLQLTTTDSRCRCRV